ncbi:MAG: ligase-associated DNA damage response endonuclease PdeM [Phycisphaerales bacterium]
MSVPNEQHLGRTSEPAIVDLESTAASRRGGGGDLAIVHGGVGLRLIPERAALVESTGTLLVADLHLDKPEAYRREGVPMPEGILEEMLDRLASAIVRTEAREVIVLGDLLHSRRGADRGTHERFAAWRERHPIPMRLVGGNHDRAASRHLDAWRLGDAGAEALLEAEGGCLSLRHEPPGARALGESGDSGGPSPRDRACVAGHLHPMASLARGTRRLLLPCFHRSISASASTLVLPAFTAFASGVRVQPAPGERVYAIAEGRVIEVTRAFG